MNWRIGINQDNREESGLGSSLSKEEKNNDTHLKIYKLEGRI